MKLKINGAILTIGRMSRGKTIKELAIAVGCKPQIISYAENNESINHDILIKIAAFLNYPESFFTRCDSELTNMYGQRGQKLIRKLFKIIYTC